MSVSSDESPKERKLVVKVCETSDLAVLNCIRNEVQILTKLTCPLVNRFEAYYEDLERFKAYLVLEHAGEKTLKKFVDEMRSVADKSTNLSCDSVKQIMTELF